MHKNNKFYSYKISKENYIRVIRLFEKSRLITWLKSHKHTCKRLLFCTFRTYQLGLMKIEVYTYSIFYQENTYYIVMVFIS